MSNEFFAEKTPLTYILHICLTFFSFFFWARRKQRKRYAGVPKIPLYYTGDWAAKEKGNSIDIFYR